MLETFISSALGCMVGAIIGCYLVEVFPPENVHWAMKALAVCVIFPSLIFGVALLRGGT